MCGKWSILQPLGSKEPAFAVRLHDERIAAGNGVHACCARGWYIIWRFSHRKIRYIHANPFLLLLIPPDVLLALRPWSTLRIGRGTVVQLTPVVGPRMTPL